MTELRNGGITAAGRKTASWISTRIWPKPEVVDQIEDRRIFLSNEIDQLFGSTVRYGPFKGLRLSGLKWWGSTDRAGMLLGLYEQEVLSVLANIQPQYRKTFIDLGAANGYYAVGVLASSLFEKTYCFEMSEKGREAIRSNAALNGVAERIRIFGTAATDFYLELPEDVVSNSVLMVDIEGAEFEILTPETFEKFSNSVVIIELHDHFYQDGAQRLSSLKTRIGARFEVMELTTRGRDLSVFPELRRYGDTDRWLICSEGRKAQPHWYVLTPA